MTQILTMNNRQSYFQRVYEVVARIPAGKVTTYGAIASCLGSAKDARMVGWALNAASLMNLPCHRVVNKTGILSGRNRFTGDVMRERLQQEGVPFTDEFTVDIQNCFWDPANKNL